MKGVYVLIISVGRDIRVNVGALGSIFFERGLYAYVGSAQNGLERRVQRHLRKAKNKFWHIDYLLDDDAVRIVRVFCKEAEKSEECRIARKLNEKGVAVKGFGCSDCRCVSHLFMYGDSPQKLEVFVEVCCGFFWGSSAVSKCSSRTNSSLVASYNVSVSKMIQQC